MSLLAIPSGTSSNAGGFYPYAIDGSLRFNDDDSAYLSRTPASAGNRKTWTWSGWVKRGNLGVLSYFFEGGSSDTDSNRLFFRFNTDDKISVQTATSVLLKTSQVFRDSSAWYHFVFVCDTTNATADDRMKIYVNGVQITSFGTRNNRSLNDDLGINLAASHSIGFSHIDSGGYFEGYMAEVNFIDGTALDPTSFGETKSGVWIPKAYSGSYGTNGFHLEFAGNANDSAGSNNWTANNISSYDYVPDSPTQNFCTMNPLDKSSAATLSEGNLRISQGASQGTTFGTVGVSSGKYYFEVRINTHANEIIGIVPETQSPSLAHPGSGSNSGFGYDTTSGRYYEDNAQDTGHATAGAGDVVMIAFDLDNSSIWAGVNGSWNEGDPSAGTGSPYTGLSSGTTYLVGTRPYNANITFNFGQDSTFLGNETAGGNSDANGIGDFKYSVPTGYLALSTANLTVAEGVDPAEENSPQDYFNTSLWTGNSSTQAITGVGFSPDLIWMKRRDASANHTLVDTVRGITKTLEPNVTGAEETQATTITAIGSDGYTLGSRFQTNGSGNTFVGWSWRGSDSSPVSNTDGSITSTVSANTDAGFSIVSYTGTGSNATVGHGLDSALDMLIVKNRDRSSHWHVWHNAITGAQFLELSSSAAVGTDAPSWNSTVPTSTVFSVGTSNSTNASGEDLIAYCFHSVEGFSKFGSYTGNGSSDGPFVYTGFRPAFLLVKHINGTQDWHMLDSERGAYNVIGPYLYANSSGSENNGAKVDFLSNGFKIRVGDNAMNSNGNTLIYMAFAETPFKYSVGR